jgi:hypothetical protein
VKKVCELGVRGRDRGAARFFETTGTDVVAGDVTFGCTNREIRELQGRFVPGHAARPVAGSIEYSGSGPC